MNEVEPQVVVITGASAGVGRATARIYGRRGAAVGLLARGADGLEAARREVEALGGRALAIPTDVSSPEQVEAAAGAVEREFGPIDAWINNAMVSVFSPAMRMREEEYRRVTDVTYLGYVWGTLAALRRMRPRDRGVIVQVGSALAYRGIPLQSAYCAAKHAVQGFTESLRAELQHDGSSIRISMVQLPALNTPQFDWVRSRLRRRGQPVPPIFQPEVAADAIVHAASTGRREMFVCMPTVKTILGNRVAPGLLDRYLGHMGVESQQTDEPEDANRPDNLFTPISGDHGAHGRFDEVARADSAQLWLSKHRGALGLLALAAGLIGVAALAPAASASARAHGESMPARGRERESGARGRVYRVGY